MAENIEVENTNDYEGFPYVTFIESNIKKTLLEKMKETSRIRPMTAWVKVTSGVQRIEGKQTDFVSMTGISKLSDNKHSEFTFEDIYEKTDSYRPRPGITDLSIQYKSQYGGVKVCTINWVVNSLAQLNEFGPYFLTPGRSVIVEFGWLDDGDLWITPTIDYEKLNPYKHKQWLMFYKKALASEGKYEGSLGIITNFEFSLRDDGGYDCTTEVMNQGGLMYGLNLVQQSELKPKKNITSSGVPFSNATSSGRWLILSDQQLNNEDLSKYKYKRVIKQFIQKDLPELIKNFTDLDVPGRSRDIHAYIDSTERKNRYITYSGLGNPIKSANDEDNDTIGSSKTFITWGFIEDIIVNQNLGAKFSNSSDGQIFRISSKETFPHNMKNESSNDPQESNISTPRSVEAPKDTSSQITSNQNFSNFYNDKRNSYKISNHKYLRSTNLSVCYINNGENANQIYGIRFDSSTVKDDSNKIKSSIGYVRHIYVNYDVVVDAFLNSDTLTDALMSILNKINSACITFWNFKLKIKETTQEMCVIDENYFDEKLTDIIKDDVNNRYDKVFLFKMFGGNGFIKNNSFTTKLPNSVAMTAMYGMNKQEDDAIQLNTDNDSFINLWDRFNYKDYFIQTEYELTPVPGSPTQDDSSPKDKEQEDKEDSLHEDTYNSGFSENFKNTMLPLKQWKSVGENDLINAMKKLIYSGGEESSKHEIVLPADLELSIEGISGLKIGDIFYCDAVPDLYIKNALFQIRAVDHTISNNYWTTKIKGILRIFDGNNPGTNVKNSGKTGNLVKDLQNKRWTGAPKKQVLEWIKREMGSILSSKTSSTIFSESLLAGIIYAETGTIINIDKDAKTNCSNIYNPDGKGTSYSIFQINDRANGAYVNERLDAGDWKNPSTATNLALFILNEKRQILKSNGLSGDELIIACVNAYNQGQGNVLKNIRNGLSIDYNSYNPDYVNRVFTAKSEYEKL